MRRPPAHLAGVLSLVVVLAGCAASGFDWNGPISVQQTAISALPGRGNVRVELSPDGVAVLRGWVEDEIGEMAVVREVSNHPDVVAVVNLIRPPYMNLH